MQNNPRLSTTSLLLTAMILAAAGMGFASFRPGLGSGANTQTSISETKQAAASVEATEILYAENLSIEHLTDRPGVTEITIKEPWPGAAPIRYAVLQTGAELGGERREYAAVIGAEPQRVISLVTPSIAHLGDLGLLERIVGVENPDYIYNSEVLARLESGDVARVGGGPELDLERVVALQPDLVFVSALGPDEAALRRLSSAGIPVVLLSDWREQSPLGRAEWLKLFGTLFNRGQEAEEIFAERAERYEQLQALTALLPDNQRPSIMANGPWQGSWPTPAGDSYIARLFGDAGGSYLWDDIPGTGSHFLDLESILARAAQAEYWFNLNYDWNTMADVVQADPRLARFQAFQNGRMYHHNARERDSGANDFWESGAGRPDLVLADLVHIMHPDLLPEHSPVYYQKLER